MPAHHRARLLILALVLGLIAALPGLAAAAGTTTESGDAGELPAWAQVAPGGTTAITGTLTGDSDVDMYQIQITDPVAFSAETLGDPSTVDTMLALFDAAGQGVYFNDDKAGFQAPGKLPAGLAIGPQSPGTYYLAISKWNRRPYSAGGAIFPAGDDNHNDVLAPTGPGGASPVTGWTGPVYTADTLPYTITLTGVGPLYSICALYDQAKAHKQGSTVPVKLQLCDVNGNNLSAAIVVVNATGLTKVDPTASASVDDSGAANSPDNDFRHDAALGGTGGYIFNLSTEDLSTGTWVLSFTVDSFADSTYTVKFDVK